MNLRAILSLSFAAALVPVAAEAGIPVTQRMTCPIGGGRFDFTTTGSYSTWGARPDGKPFGSWHFPLDLPECPANGLVVYREFSEAELERLRPLVASPEYQALRQSGDTPYYRAYWLMRRMDAPAPDTLWTLVQASWQAEPDPALRRRYLEELVAEAPRLGEPDNVTVLAVRSRVINALRELGRFEEAEAMLRATPVESVAPDSATVRSTADWRGHYRTLAGLIERRDSSIEPIAMIPWREGRRRCEQPDGLDEIQRATCRERLAEEAAAPAPPADHDH
jgi:hypothetical protein